MMTDPTDDWIRVHDWEISRSQQRLRVRGVDLEHFKGRRFAVLLHLAQNRGRVVTKGELLSAVWGPVVVEESNVAKQVEFCREAVGAWCIETEPKVGYLLRDLPAVGPATTSESLGSQHLLDTSSELVGRDSDVASVTRLLSPKRLVTVCGPGGVGKTVLAQQIVTDWRARNPKGLAYWVDLSVLKRGEDLTATICSALGIAQDARLTPRMVAATLSSECALIAVDNCEQLVDTLAHWLHEVVPTAPQIQWLLTSRQPIGLAEEHLYRLQPLAVASDADAPLLRRECAAVVLFERRIRAHDPAFVVNEVALDDMLVVCRRLDGLPLALEMAAARAASLGVGEVSRQLSGGVELVSGSRVAPARHKSLTGTYEWSYGLLGLEERQLFRWLQPFSGGFTAASASAIFAAMSGIHYSESACSALLASLVDQSMVHRDLRHPGRFLLLESAREYARQRVLQAEEKDRLQWAHAEVALEAVEGCHQDYLTQPDDAWLANYTPERGNVFAALAWACRVREPDLIARAVCAAAKLDEVRLGFAEVVLFNLPVDILLCASPPVRGRACLELGWAHHWDGNRGLGARLLEQACQDFAELGAEDDVFLALTRLMRTYELDPARPQRALAVGSELSRVDASKVPLRSRLAREIYREVNTAVPQEIARLESLEHVAIGAGFKALAGLARAHQGNVLMTNGRFDEVVDKSFRWLSDSDMPPRVIGLLQSNLTLSSIRRGDIRSAIASARAAVRSMPSSCMLVAGAFALAATSRQLWRESALLDGWERADREARQRSQDVPEAQATADVDVMLAAALPSASLKELRRLGAALDVHGVLSIAERIAAAS